MGQELLEFCMVLYDLLCAFSGTCFALRWSGPQIKGCMNLSIVVLREEGEGIVPTTLRGEITFYQHSKPAGRIQDALLVWK